MRNKNEKGFALVLSLVLMLAMSLMGGALIVITASDHKSNNISDEFQQTFSHFSGDFCNFISKC